MNDNDIFYGHITPISDEDVASDIKYFTDKLAACKKSGNTEGADRCMRQLGLLEDAIIIYRLTRKPDKTVETHDFSNLTKEDGEKKISELLKRYREKKMIDPPNEQ